jgi:hypothetical protein
LQGQTYQPTVKPVLLTDLGHRTRQFQEENKGYLSLNRS